ATVASKDGSDAHIRLTGDAFQLDLAGTGLSVGLLSQRAWDAVTVQIATPGGAAVARGNTWIIRLDGVDYPYTADSTDIGKVVAGLVAKLDEGGYLASPTWSQVDVQLTGKADPGETWTLTLNGKPYPVPVGAGGSVDSVVNALEGMLGSDGYTVKPNGSKITISSATPFTALLAVTGGTGGEGATFSGTVANATLKVIGRKPRSGDIAAFSAAGLFKAAADAPTEGPRRTAHASQ